MTPSSRLTVATAFHWIFWNAATSALVEKYTFE